MKIVKTHRDPGHSKDSRKSGSPMDLAMEYLNTPSLDVLSDRAL